MVTSSKEQVVDGPTASGAPTDPSGNPELQSSPLTVESAHPSILTPINEAGLGIIPISAFSPQQPFSGFRHGGVESPLACSTSPSPSNEGSLLSSGASPTNAPTHVGRSLLDGSGCFQDLPSATAATDEVRHNARKRFSGSDVSAKMALPCAQVNGIV